jgi:hypothetical protein
MKHPNEEQLIAYHDGEVSQRGTIAAHLTECPECRAELKRIDAVLAAIHSIPVPDPGENYGQHVWQQIVPRLPVKRRGWWKLLLSAPRPVRWLEPRRLAALGAMAALVLAAFLAGRLTTRPGAEPPVADASKVRERVLILAVGEHLGRSEMVLVELANAAPGNPGLKQINISAEQRRAESLLEENRLYRQAALEEGDTALAALLDELERVLLDVAHSPEELTPAQLGAIRQRIEAQGILFKVRVVGKELQQRQESPQLPPGRVGSEKKERNKA